MNYEEMLDYVYTTLRDNNALKSKKENQKFRDRFMHTKRVLGWAKRICEGIECDKDVLFTACVFHDIGYSMGKENHAHNSAIMFINYAKEHDFDYEFTMSVADCIAKHSDKSLISDSTSQNELVLLLEADLLDEEGALGIAWDLLALGDADCFNVAVDGILKHSGHILTQDYMKTPLARKYWDEKKMFVLEFLTRLKSDLFLED